MSAATDAAASEMMWQFVYVSR